MTPTLWYILVCPAPLRKAAADLNVRSRVLANIRSRTDQSAFAEAEKFVVLLNVEGVYRRLFSVQYERRANGLGYYVHLPYFAHTEGVLGRLVVEAPPGSQSQINLRDMGTTTTHRLKFVHNADGEAHFSQDSRVFTRVRTQTPPLTTYQRHLFTINFWGADAFEVAQAKDLRGPRSERTSIRFDPPAPPLPASQIAGRIIAEQVTVPPGGIAVDPRVAARGKITEHIVYTRGDGSQNYGIPLVPLLHRADVFFIILTYIPMDRSSADAAASLTLVGGWSAPQGAARPLTGLIIHYTDRDPEEWERLVRERGTIDLPPDLLAPRQQ
jgi:hypothetical protein